MSWAARFLLGAATLGVPASQAAAWDDPVKAEAAFYSSLCYSAKNGQQGERLTLLNSYTKYEVVYQESTTSMSPSLGIAEIFAGQISFRVQAVAGEILTFKGTITPDYIIGLFAGDSSHNRGRAEIRWPRVSADRSPLAACSTPVEQEKPAGASGLRERH